MRPFISAVLTMAEISVCSLATMSFGVLTAALGWQAYAAIGTEREGEFAKIADEVIAKPVE